MEDEIKVFEDLDLYEKYNLIDKLPCDEDILIPSGELITVDLLVSYKKFLTVYIDILNHPISILKSCPDTTIELRKAFLKFLNSLYKSIDSSIVSVGHPVFDEDYKCTKIILSFKHGSRPSRANLKHHRDNIRDGIENKLGFISYDLWSVIDNLPFEIHVIEDY